MTVLFIISALITLRLPRTGAKTVQRIFTLYYSNKPKADAIACLKKKKDFPIQSFYFAVSILVFESAFVMCPAICMPPFRTPRR